MEGAPTLMPPNTDLSDVLLSAKILEGPEYEKI